MECRPFIAVPIGDPAGIGPEIVIKAVLDSQTNKTARCVIIGDTRIISDALRFCGIQASVRVIAAPEDGIYDTQTLNVMQINNIAMEHFTIGKISGMCGSAAYEYIERSITLALSHNVCAVATPPINKESLKAGGVPYIGHTEIFGALTGTADPLTMFEVHGMRVFFLSRHMSLADACRMITKERIINYVERCVAALRQLGVTDGTMAIAGLNPHSGEHGLFGTEEVTDIEPAVQELCRRGYQVQGPIGADSVFHLALQGRYNSVLSLYHDQGHIATKTLDFERTISLTLGMPILRTSVDHGTAFDIAGTNTASCISMKEAIRLAALYAPDITKLR